MNHDGLDKMYNPLIWQRFSVTSQSLVISYNKEWLKWVEVKGLLIWRDIEKAIALMCGTVFGSYGSRDLKPKQLVIWICKAVFNCS